MIIFLILSLLITSIIIFNYYWGGSSQVCFKKGCFYVELAKTAEERSRGLMFRESLELNKGMLFMFEKEGNYSFWMRDTPIPLDIIWIDKNKEIVFIKRDFQPCEKELPCLPADPGKNAKYVLEVNGGIAEKIGLGIGDEATIKALK